MLETEFFSFQAPKQYILLLSYSAVLKLCISFYQWTPLHVAAREGYMYTVKSLVEKKANIKLTNKDGVSVIWLLVAE